MQRKSYKHFPNIPKNNRVQHYRAKDFAFPMHNNCLYPYFLRILYTTVRNVIKRIKSNLTRPSQFAQKNGYFQTLITRQPLIFEG